MGYVDGSRLTWGMWDGGKCLLRVKNRHDQGYKDVRNCSVCGRVGTFKYITSDWEVWTRKRGLDIYYLFYN